MILRFLNWLVALLEGDTNTPIEIPVKTEKPKLVALAKGQIGVDISHHNKSVDLPLLADSVDFIYMKATEGTSFVSSKYEERAIELRTLDVPWGAYHYYKVDSDPLRQANHFLKYVDVTSGLPPVLDIEAINNDFKPKHRADLLKFLAQIEAVTGITPIIYTSFYYARDVIKTDEQFAKYPLWIAWYRPDFAGVKIPKPWTEAKIWQYTEEGRIKGVNGNVDINRVMS